MSSASGGPRQALTDCFRYWAAPVSPYSLSPLEISKSLQSFILSYMMRNMFGLPATVDWPCYGPLDCTGDSWANDGDCITITVSGQSLPSPITAQSEVTCQTPANRRTGEPQVSQVGRKGGDVLSVSRSDRVWIYLTTLNTTSRKLPPILPL